MLCGNPLFQHCDRHRFVLVFLPSSSHEAGSDGVLVTGRVSEDLPRVLEHPADGVDVAAQPPVPDQVRALQLLRPEPDLRQRLVRRPVRRRRVQRRLQLVAKVQYLVVVFVVLGLGSNDGKKGNARNEEKRKGTFGMRLKSTATPWSYQTIVRGRSG